jgi:hypothetical protein
MGAIDDPSQCERVKKKIFGKGMERVRSDCLIQRVPTLTEQLRQARKAKAKKETERQAAELDRLGAPPYTEDKLAEATTQIVHYMFEHCEAGTLTVENGWIRVKEVRLAELVHHLRGSQYASVDSAVANRHKHACYLQIRAGFLEHHPDIAVDVPVAIPDGTPRLEFAWRLQ